MSFKLPGFYYASVSNLSGDYGIDAGTLLDPSQPVWENEVFYIGGRLESAEHTTAKVGYLVLDPVVINSPRRYLPSGSILSPASPERVLGVIDSDLSKANPSLRTTILEFTNLEKD